MKKLSFAVVILVQFFTIVMNGNNVTYVSFVGPISGYVVKQYSQNVQDVEVNTWLLDTGSGNHVKLIEKKSDEDLILLVDGKGQSYQLNFIENTVNIFNASGMFAFRCAITKSVSGPDLPKEYKVYKISIRNDTNKFLTLPEYDKSNGIPLYQHSDESNPGQRFKFKLTDEGFLSIVRSDCDNCALALFAGSSADGNAICQSNYENKRYQKFLLIPIDGKYFKIVTLDGKAFTVGASEYATAEYEKIIQLTYTEQKNQQFMLIEYSEYHGAERRAPPKEED